MENDWEVAETRAGQRVRELRQERGWSQTDLARRLGAYGFDLTQTTVAKLERGARPIRLNEVAALADIFGVPVSDLVGGDEGMLVNEHEQAALIRRRLHFEARITDAEQKLEEAKQRQEMAARQVAQLNQILGDLHNEWRRVNAAIHGGRPVGEFLADAAIFFEEKAEQEGQSDG